MTAMSTCTRMCVLAVCALATCNAFGMGPARQLLAQPLRSSMTHYWSSTAQPAAASTPACNSLSMAVPTQGEVQAVVDAAIKAIAADKPAKALFGGGIDVKGVQAAGKPKEGCVNIRFLIRGKEVAKGVGDAKRPGGQGQVTAQTEGGKLVRCSAASVAANWRSCCADGTCVGGACGSGALPPSARVLFIGNSYVRELAQAAVCQNLDLLMSITVMPYARFYGHSMLGGARLPRPQAWAYSREEGLRDPQAWAYSREEGLSDPQAWAYSREEGLRDPQGVRKLFAPDDDVAVYDFANGARVFVAGVRKRFAPDDDVAVYDFANGARVFVAVNTPLAFTPQAGAGDAERALGLTPLAYYLRFRGRNLEERALGLTPLAFHLRVRWRELTAVVVNPGNPLGWARGTFCAQENRAKWLRAPRAFVAVCDYLSERE
ncbi:hypothetical protein JKP88DRAFT_348264 [Tribonema minus]|uniref:Uncharacterized protein n=1 Tax=Tribonema minus TaxID=303371 RepID=A0A835Z578_9STRA|nr:hypothetical protein JKP88DRAFT_348264 [Tribonema minus]